jgi:bifunctional non-homologous end joining protein LigD
MIKSENNIEFTSLDKIMYPEAKLTKEDVLSYYDFIADFMLPHLTHRPLMLQRFPSGIGEKGFYQKNISDYFPDWIDRVTVTKEGGSVTHVICNNKDTLLYLAN